jgi:hypothetical protein
MGGMAEKRRRPTREELDERIRIVLGKIPANVDSVAPVAPPEPLAVRVGAESGRIVSGTIEGSGATHA